MRRPGAVVLVLVAFLVSLGVASAASLAVSSGDRTTTATSHPCPGTATATAASPTSATWTTFSGVGVTLPAACGNRPVQVTLLNGTTVVASGAGAVNGTGTVPMTGTFTASAGLTVRATVSGWDLPSTWSYSPPASCVVTTGGSTASCTAAVTVFTGQKDGGTASATYYDLTVATTSTSWVAWRVTFDFTHPLYAGLVHTRLGNSTLDAYSDGTTSWNGTTNNVVRTSTCSAMPSSFVVTGTATGPTNNRFNVVRSNRPRSFSIVVNRTEAGYFDLLSPGCA